MTTFKKAIVFMLMLILISSASIVLPLTYPFSADMTDSNFGPSQKSGQVAPLKI